jgi:hypothetical protein
MRGDGAIILDILNLVGRFFKFGMETKQFPSPDKFAIANFPLRMKKGHSENRFCNIIFRYYAANMLFFGLTYLVTGILCAASGLLGKWMKPLRLLGILILVVSAFNIYIELWKNSYVHTFVVTAAILLICFLVAHGEWTIPLMRQTVSAKRAHLYYIAFVPFIWMLGASILLLLSQFRDLENPPLAVYAFLALMSTLQVPAFAAGKDRILKTVDKDLLVSGFPSSFPLVVSVFLLVPTLVTLFIQILERDDWTMFSLNTIFAGANLSLVLISRPRVGHSTGPPIHA